MEAPIIVNLMRTMKVVNGLNDWHHITGKESGKGKAVEIIRIEDVYHTFPNQSKLYTGRPEMLLMKMKNKRNIQIFRGGTVQILGRLTDEEAEEMRHEFVMKLRKVKWMQNSKVTPIMIKNLVMRAQILKEIPLHNINWSNSQIMYEAELFPAALIQKWKPVHIAAFHNGKVIFTGLKSLNQFHSIFSELKLYLLSPSFTK